MHIARGTLIIFVTLLLLSPLGRVIAQEADFQGLGQPPGLTSGSIAFAVSGDGQVVVGGAASQVNPGPFRWTAETGLVMIGSWPHCRNTNNGGASDTSIDGSVVVGSVCLMKYPFYQGFRWEDGRTIEILGPNDDCQFTQAWGVSDDGSVVAGAFRNSDCVQQAFLWNGNMLPLPGGVTSFAWDISGDGSVVVGHMANAGEPARPVRWINAGPPKVLHSLPGEAIDITSDGAVIVGRAAESEGDPQRACRWIGDGEIEFLPALPDTSQSWARAVSDDGEIVVGTSTVQGSGFRAFIWREQVGTQELQSVLENEFGLDLTGWTLQRARGISDDGTVIVGQGVNPDGHLEAFRAVVPRVEQDTDGDGLLDSWETDGIDIDGDGEVDIDLPAMGADPNHKDLFLEIDAMSGAEVSALSVELVEQAFANAPGTSVNNPDGLDGINLHVLIDEADLPLIDPWNDDNPAFPQEFATLKDQFFGTPEDRAHPEAKRLLETRRKIFRYCIYAKNLSSDSLGVARSIPANDMIVAIDAVNESCKALVGDCFTYEAAVLMHEFGHCLGLEHGGDDFINFKPNYISVMNYLYDLPFADGADWKLDFSHGTMLPLDESNLDETTALVDLAGHNEGVTTYFGIVQCGPVGSPGQGPLGACCMPDETCTLETPDTCALIGGLYQGDGSDCTSADCSLCQTIEITGTNSAAATVSAIGLVDFNGDGDYTTDVCQDLNYLGSDAPVGGELPSPCEILNDHNDWASLTYALQQESPAGVGDPPSPPVELTVEDVILLGEILSAPCLADVNNNGAVDVPDLLEVLAAWNTTEPNAADINLDSIVDTADLLELLAQWGPCP